MNAYLRSNNRAVSSWLDDIPSDAGGGSEATLIAPSISDPESSPPGQQRNRDPTRIKDSPTPASRPNRDLDFSPKSPTRPPGAGAASPAVPIRSPNPGARHGGAQDLRTTPVTLPIRTPNKNTNSNVNTNPTSNQTPNLHTLRQTIITNFLSRCLFCNPPAFPSQSQPIGQGAEQPPSQDQAPRNCPRCAAAREYVNRPYHNARFLTHHLKPISEVLSYDEMVAYVNEVIISRLSSITTPITPTPIGAPNGNGNGNGNGNARGGGGRRWDRARPYPTLDDFDCVRAVAELRREVLGGGNRRGLRMDRVGMVRGEGNG